MLRLVLIKRIPTIVSNAYILSSRRISETRIDEISSNDGIDPSKNSEESCDESCKFFGFDENSIDDPIIHPGKKGKRTDVLEKYEDLMRPTRRYYFVEKVFATTYGTIRYDLDNVPSFHGQFEPVDESMKANLRNGLDLPEMEESSSQNVMVGRERSSESKRSDIKTENSVTQSPLKTTRHKGEHDTRPRIDYENGDLGTEQYFPTRARHFPSGVHDPDVEDPLDSLKKAKKETGSKDHGDTRARRASTNVIAGGNFVEEHYFGNGLSITNDDSNTMDSTPRHMMHGIQRVRKEPRTKGYDGKKEKRTSEVETAGANFIEEHYFGSGSPITDDDSKAGDSTLQNTMYNIQRVKKELKTKDYDGKKAKQTCEDVTAGTNFVEEVYFGNGDGISRAVGKSSPMRDEVAYNAKNKENLLRDDRESSSGKFNSVEKVSDTDSRSSAVVQTRKVHNRISRNLVRDSETSFAPDAPVREVRDRVAFPETGNSKSRKKPTVEENESDTGDDVVVKQFNRSNVKDQSDATLQPPSAFDYVMNLRNEKKGMGPTESKQGGSDQVVPSTLKLEEKYDTQGFRILKNEVIDLEKELAVDVINLLKKSVVYDDHDILAISKPYGLICHHGAGHRHTLDAYLPDLAKHFIRNDPDAKLHLVHRLDRDSTGVLLLAKTQQRAHMLQSLLSAGKIAKVYWAITKGVPELKEGIIKMPLAEAEVDGVMRIVVKPDRSEISDVIKSRSSIVGRQAITSFKVLVSVGNAALVELRPETGQRHQIRVHLASGLGCPILGDHKYSHFPHLKPQRLPGDMLQKLGIRQSKARNVPMHLHAKAVVIPDVLDGRDLVISAHLPPHFVKNQKRLRLQIGK